MLLSCCVEQDEVCDINAFTKWFARLGVYAASCHVALPISVLTINNEVFIPI